MIVIVIEHLKMVKTVYFILCVFCQNKKRTREMPLVACIQMETGKPLSGDAAQATPQGNEGWIK